MRKYLFVAVFVWLCMFTTRQAFSQAAPKNSTPVTLLCRDAEEAEFRPVWQGKNGWLFETADLVTEVQLRGSLAPLRRYSAALKAQGITPVALVVPTRGSVAFDQMGDHVVFADYDPELAAQGYRSFLSQLRQHGFVAPDLLTVARRVGDRYFLKRDHHWSAAAARASAEAVAMVLKTQLTSIDEQKFGTYKRPSETQIGTLQARAKRRCPQLALPPEEVARYETINETTKPIGDALFEEVTVPVALAGTSNSKRGANKPDLNFEGFLQGALGLEVLNTSFPGSGIFGSLQAYLLSTEYQTTPPNVLVWETLYTSWHKRSGLDIEQRQLVPSVYGNCKNQLRMRKLDVLAKGKTVVLKNLLPLNLRGHNTYVQLTVKDLSIARFDLELIYRATQERLNVSPSARAPKTDKVYMELSSVIDEPLKEVILHVSKDISGPVQVSLCKTPKPLAEL